MPTQINWPEDYQYGEELGQCLRFFQAVSSKGTSIVVEEDLDLVRGRLQSFHPGVREDVADNTVTISPVRS